MQGREPLAGIGTGAASARPDGRFMCWCALAVAPISAGGLLLLQTPSGLVLPLLSSVLVVTGLVLAAAAYVRGIQIERVWVGPYEVAGALVFVGFAAALMAQTDQALAVFGQIETSSSAGPGN
jgi:hypothetical protein